MGQRIDNLELVKITKDKVVYKCGSDIITVPMTQQAQEILRYYNKLPAND